MRYALLLRGINVGGKNKVVMADLREHLANLGFEHVDSYINSGNLFFDSQEPRTTIIRLIGELFEKHYSFIQSFALVSQADYEQEVQSLPTFWQDQAARKDVLFYTEELDQTAVATRLSALPLATSESLYLGKLAAYWVKWDEKDYLKTSYHKLLIKELFYKQVTIRNGKTFEKIGHYLSKEK